MVGRKHQSTSPTHTQLRVHFYHDFKFLNCTYLVASWDDKEAKPLAEGVIGSNTEQVCLPSPDKRRSKGNNALPSQRVFWSLQLPLNFESCSGKTSVAHQSKVQTFLITFQNLPDVSFETSLVATEWSGIWQEFKKSSCRNFREVKINLKWYFSGLEIIEL